MFGTKLVLPRKGRDEGEKPFWISYADLMTALMMLFLVVMAVSLFAISSRGDKHEVEVDECMVEFEHMAKALDQDISVDTKNRRVGFGARAVYARDGEYKLDAQQADALRSFAPIVIRFADQTPCGKKLLKRVLVEGYTNNKGGYLMNLDLSLKRAHGVLCAILDSNSINSLDTDKRDRVRSLFFVGGYSFNSQKQDQNASRRVELQLDFWTLDDLDKKKNVQMTSLPIDESKEYCHLQ